jgi:hypothetical protein
VHDREALHERGLRAFKIEQALDRTARGGISFGAAAHQVGVSQSELARHAYARGMEPLFSAKTLAEELGQFCWTTKSRGLKPVD